MKTIALANSKGGVAKSLTSLAAADALTRRGFKTLLIDLDSQQNASIVLDADLNKTDILDVLKDPAKIKDAIQPLEFFDVIPASQDLAFLESELDGTGKVTRLKEALDNLGNDYAFCIIDTQPAMSLSTMNALTAADYVLIPAQSDFLSLQGFKLLAEAMDDVKATTNDSIKPIGVFLTRYDKRSKHTRQIEDFARDMAESLGTKLLNTRIRENVKAKESMAEGKPIYQYDKRSNAAIDYEALTDEILGEIGL